MSSLQNYLKETKLSINDLLQDNKILLDFAFKNNKTLYQFDSFPLAKNKSNKEEIFEFLFLKLNMIPMFSSQEKELCPYFFNENGIVFIVEISMGKNAQAWKIYYQGQSIDDFLNCTAIISKFAPYLKIPEEEKNTWYKKIWNWLFCNK